jgi:hypothetical protein
MPNFSRRVRSTVRCSLALAALFTLTACSSKDEPKYPDTNSFCNGRAGAECSTDVVQACAAPNRDTCVAKRQAVCVATLPRAATYNSAGAEGCVTAVSTAFADARLSTQENRTVIEACTPVFDGPRDVNDTCSADIDCKVSAGLRCVLGAGLNTGTCQVPERVMGGGLCSKPNQSCVPGFHCGPTAHCDVNGQVGEPCTDALPCIETARCSAGKCEKKFDDGSTCASDQECANALCARGSAATQGICVSQMTLAPNEPFCIDAR